MKSKIKSMTHHLLAGLAGCAIFTCSALAGEQTAAETLGWKLGVQAYTFRALTFYETLDKAHELGLKYIEMYPGQKLRPGSDVKSGVGMSAADIIELQTRLKATDVKLVSFGVSPIPTNEPAARQRFEWAKNLGIEVLVTETTPNETLDKLSAEYGIKIALHNHPQTWPPEKVLAATKGLNPLIGSCADVGHWKRAGLDPVATLKQVGDRVVHSHFKDLATNKDAKPTDDLYTKMQDVPWGTGECNMRGMMEQLKSQGYKGYLIIEYEHGTVDELMRDLPKCIQFFNQTATEIAK
jgi:sugar phosphate isomerase/epimerase